MPFLPDAEEAFELSYLDQISCFESLRAYEGRLFCLSMHVDRLWESCDSLSRRLLFSKKEMTDWIKVVLKESGFRQALMRVSVHWNDASEVRSLAIVRQFDAYPDSIYKKGVEIKTAVGRRWTLRAQDPQIKSSQYVTGVLASLDFAKTPTREIIFLNQDQTVSEGSVSNLFIVTSQKTLLTPPASSGILRGVTREVVIRLARRCGLEVVERALTRHEVYSAAECFITNTSSEVLPVVSYDGRTIGEGVPGKTTLKLLEQFRNFVREKKEI